jgi:hypothetical protein
MIYNQIMAQTDARSQERSSTAEPTIASTASKKRQPPFSLRLTPEERGQLERDAAGQSIAEHVKAILFKDAPRTQPRGKTPVKDHQALGEVLAKLGASRISNNLNQLAYAANTGNLPFDPETIQRLNEAYQHVREIRDLLIKSLGLKEPADTQSDKRAAQRRRASSRPVFDQHAKDRGSRP